MPLTARNARANKRRATSREEKVLEPNDMKDYAKLRGSKKKKTKLALMSENRLTEEMRVLRLEN